MTCFLTVMKYVAIMIAAMIGIAIVMSAPMLAAVATVDFLHIHRSAGVFFYLLYAGALSGAVWGATECWSSRLRRRDQRRQRKHQP